MRSTWVLTVAGIMGLAGCASVSDGAASMQAESASSAFSSVLVGPACLLAAGVNPSAGVQVAAEGDSIVVHYARLGGKDAVERLDLLSLEPTAPAVETRRDVSRTAPADDQRVTLDGGRFMLIWKSGDPEHGYRAMAQTFNETDSSPRGAPVAISPFGADVSGPLGATTADGRNVVATLSASTGKSFVAYAVPIRAL